MVGEVPGGPGLGVGQSLDHGRRQLVLLVVLLALRTLSREEEILISSLRSRGHNSAASAGENLESGAYCGFGSSCGGC